MRLLFSLTYYAPYISGLTLHAQMIAEALVRKGHEVAVLSMQYDENLPEREIMNNVRIERARTIYQISKGFISFDWLVKSAFEVRLHDVVIIHLPQFEGVVPAIFAKLLGKRIVVFYHCDVILPQGFFNRLVQFLLMLSNLLTLLLADRILHNTEDFARNSKVLSKFRRKIQFVYPPIKSYKSNNRIKKLLISKSNTSGDYRIGFIARLAADKGVEYLLEAIPVISSKLSNFKIIIAGSTDPVGEEKYRERISALIDRYKEHVVVLGKLKDEEMGPFYSMLDVLVLPSVNSTESFGTVQIEAMRQGAPVVVSDIPGVRVPVQRTGMGIIVPSKNSPMLADAIVKVLLNKKSYIANNAKVESEFSFTKTIDIYEKYIKSN